MKYVYAGYCKTGTKSIGLAMKKLGYKVYDFEETMMLHHNQWLEIHDRNTSQERIYQLLYEMYKDVDVVCDIPAFAYWQQILHVFPEAKCIFFERPDHEKWWTSMEKQTLESVKLGGAIPDWIRRWIFWILLPTIHKAGTFSDVCYLLLFSDSLRPRVDWLGRPHKTNKILAINNYRKHNSDFLANCPKDRRLVIKNFGTWPELCEFTGDAIPDFEFPHENKAGGIVEATQKGQGSMGDDEANFKNTIKREFLDRLVKILLVLVISTVFYKNWVWPSAL